MTAQKLNTIGIRTVRDIQNRKEDVIRLLGRQGQMIADLAMGIDEREVKPYRPEDAKSISREITFQEDVDDVTFLKDVLVLLSLCVERRAKRYGLYGQGVTLKLTYADMKSITRSRQTSSGDSAAMIYEEAARMLDQTPHRPVRLIGAGLYHLSSEENRQLCMEEIVESAKTERLLKVKELLSGLQEKYHLDFEGHLDAIFKMETLHKTVEYMRKHR